MRCVVCLQPLTDPVENLAGICDLDATEILQEVAAGLRKL